jgi:hypothetical protein
MKLTKLGKFVHGLAGTVFVFSALGVAGTMDYQSAIKSTEGVSGTAWSILLVSSLVFWYTEWLKSE